MHRTSLKRKTPLQAKASMKRQAMKRTSRSKTQKRKAQSDTRWRSEAYLAWVRSLPCCLCGGPGGVAHHFIGLGWGLSGMGLTAADSYAMPVDALCHSAVHTVAGVQALQPQWLRSTLERAVAEFPDEPELMRALVFVAERQSSEQAGLSSE